MNILGIIIILSLIGIIASPFIFFYFTQGILITEVIPADQHIIQKPNAGDHIEVYGPWVNDTHGMIPDWNEKHPVRYIKNLETGKESGNRNYNGELMAGGHSPSRLSILDKVNPYRTARG